MTENTIRCRMKWGDTEFEIEGVANKEIKEKIDYVYEAFKLAITKEPKSQRKKGDVKSTKRSGRKPPFYKSNIQRIIDEEPEWFVDKGVGEVTNKLKTEYGVPGANEMPVGTALTRFFKDGLLTRKDANGKYLYSIVSLKKTGK